MLEIKHFNKVLVFFVLLGDMILLNLTFILFYAIWGERFWASDVLSPLHGSVLLTLCYLVCTSQNGAVIHHPVVRVEKVIAHVVRNVAFFALLSVALLALCRWEETFSWYSLGYYVAFAALASIYRILFRYFLKIYRKKGGGKHVAVLVGSHENMQELYHSLVDDPASAYRVGGYFDDYPLESFSQKIPYLGKPKDVVPYLKENAGKVEQLYCSMPSNRSEEIVPIINYCENNLVRFFSVPNVRNYLKRRMWFEMMGSVPVLSIHRVPLSKVDKRLMKRLFDFLVSLLFLCTLFPVICLVVGIAIKISSPGPVFFRQKRSGEDGREFWCYKFRSMRVNTESDTLQATANDPRKTRVGNFIRKTNIDELPQFINVLKGDMSIVGPRPHMLKHTEEYSAMINKFMVRHLVKPGITGWAQVNGFRGETKELWQMEGRVANDIWYIENWTFALDLYIIYRTVRVTISGDKKAY